MNRFAALIDRLVFTPARNGKLDLLGDYWANTPDPDRGWALAALTGGLELPHAKPALVRALIEARMDPMLFRWSYDFVGDLAETVALAWPAAAAPDGEAAPALSAVVETLRAAARGDVGDRVAWFLDRLDDRGRFALLKLVTGAMRVGVSARLTRLSLARWSGRELAAIEDVWHGLAPPYGDLFAWLEGRAAAPAPAATGFRPLMLAQPLEEEALERLDPADFAAEWKWDGIRVQAVRSDDGCRLYARSGDEISAGFPEIAGMLAGLARPAVLDGELLVVRDGAVAPFNDLQQRLNRKRPDKALLARHPAHIRLYDLLADEGGDRRSLPFIERRRRLEDWHGRVAPALTDLSPLIAFADWDALAALRAGARAAGIEGVMLKRRDSTYVAGRPVGAWYKWKRGPLTVDGVLMYAQRGHGRRSSYYSDFTIGAWSGDELVPVGKAYFGFTDAELTALDRWVRANTVERFGPVRAVAPALVLELAFDSVHRSGRHKSGIALRFPRIARIRWDKLAAEADRVETLERMIVE